jgi:2-oxoglutarate dehydrogenase E2 component (dihydrolipoamide succinyltransferase)
LAVDSDKATLELPAEASGIITLKAEEGDSSSRAVVCLIDTAAAKPEGSARSDSARSRSSLKAEAPKAATQQQQRHQQQLTLQEHHLQQQEKY